MMFSCLNHFSRDKRFCFVSHSQPPIEMKWHNLMLLLASLMLIASVFAEEIEIPDDIDDDDLDEDEEILRLLEDKRIVSGRFCCWLSYSNIVFILSWKLIEIKCQTKVQIKQLHYQAKH